MTAPVTGRIVMKNVGSLQFLLAPITAVYKIKKFGHC